jgi:hypothetical protein
MLQKTTTTATTITTGFANLTKLTSHLHLPQREALTYKAFSTNSLNGYVESIVILT